MISNGGFPPLKFIKEDKIDKKIKKERYYTPKIKELNIKNILSQSIVKPMVDLNQPKIHIINSL
jgi:hypothetical protein